MPNATASFKAMLVTMSSDREMELLRQQDALARFGEFALRSDDLDAILHEACRLVSEALRTDMSKVMELQEDGVRLLVRSGIGWPPGTVGKATANAEPGTPEGYALTSGQPAISENVDAEDQFTYAPFVREAGVKALVNVIIIGPDHHPPYGLLQVDSRHPRSFSRDDTNFLRSYANLLAAAVERLRAAGEARRAASQLHASEERFRRALATETVGVIFFDREGRITEANRTFLGMCGYTHADIMSRHLTWRVLTPPEWMARSEEALAQLRATGHSMPYEKECYRKDGSRWWGLFAAQQLTEDEAVEFVLDVSEKRKAEAQLRESEERFRTLAESIPQLVWRSRNSGQRTWGSPQWTAYSGLSDEDSHGEGWLAAIHPDDRAAAIAAWEIADKSGVFSAEYRIRRAADGVYRWFQSGASPVRDAAGQIVEWFGTSTDIDDRVRAREVLARSREELEALVAARTADLARALDALRDEAAERSRAEEALRQSQKMDAVGRLTGGLAHDFNNMLQGIAGSVEVARRRLNEGRTTEAARFLETIRTAVDRAAGLTHRLLAFARRQRLEPQPVDPDGLVAGMAELLRRTMGPGIRVELNLRDGAWWVLCDPNELESALLNLCINARDAMAEGGLLAISTEDEHISSASGAGQEEVKPGNYVAIIVADTGAGMPPDVLAQAVEPFFTTKPLGQGTGLGLSQVYGFVRQSGGFVQLESAPGVGTTVRLMLPWHEPAEPTAPEVQPAPERAGDGETVLLVDDENAVREPVAEMLRGLGYQVLEADDGPCALRILKDVARLDLLVTDVGLPNGMNGWQLAEAVRHQLPGLPVLFVTGYSGTVLPPGVAVIRKPFDFDTLARRIQSTLATMRR